MLMVFIIQDDSGKYFRLFTVGKGNEVHMQKKKNAHVNTYRYVLSS